MEGDTDMSLFSRAFAIRIAVTAAAGLVPAAFAQTAGAGTTPAHGDIQRAADLVNLMRTVLDPNPAPVLASPAERAVSGKTTVDPASSVATTIPVVIMPDIETPEEESGELDKADAGTEKPASAAEDASRKKDADEDDSDEYPPFSYVFFFGEYVPYFEGWYYYSDRWLWGRRWPAPPEPPGWIPPPPPPRPRPPDPVRPDIGPGPAPRPGNGGSASGKTTARPSASAQKKSPNEPGNTIPVVPGRHRIPRKNETEVEPLPKDSSIPVAPGQHRISGRTAGQNPAPQNSGNIPVAPSQHRIPRSNR